MTKRKKPEDKLKTGRPEMYTPELGARICELIATHSCGLRKLTMQYPELPDTETIYRWVMRYPDFCNSYKKARELQQEVHVNEMVEIANDDSNDMIQNDKGWVGNPTAVSRAKLKIDTLKWQAARLAPTVYGDRIQQEVTITKHEDFLKQLAEKDNE